MSTEYRNVGLQVYHEQHLSCIKSYTSDMFLFGYFYKNSIRITCAIMTLTNIVNG